MVLSVVKVPVLAPRTITRFLEAKKELYVGLRRWPRLGAQK